MKALANSGKILHILRDLLILCILGNGIVILSEPGLQWSIRAILINCFFSVAVGFPAWRGSVLYTNLMEKKFPWLEKPVQRLVYQTLGLLLFACLVMITAILIWVLISGEVTRQNMMEGALRSMKMIVIFMLISIVLTNAVLFFVKWREAVVQQEELKRAHLSLQYQSLKSQIRPHFLFNSLSSLVTLIKKDPDKATEFVHKLSDVYRYVLEQSEQELVPISEELRFLEDYLYLQKIRYGESLQIKLDLNREGKGMVVPLSLQMTVENAIKHNVVSAEHPLQIEIFQTDGNRLEIRNRVNSKEAVEHSTGTGLQNLSKRIAYFSDSPLEYREEDGYFIVRLPMVQS